MQEFQYPEIKHFTPVMFATEPGAGEFQWAAGFVVCPKNQSCDIVVFRSDGAIDYRSDCWHADDPRCKSSPEMYRQFGRGVFRLAPDEQERRMVFSELAEARRERREILSRFDRLRAEQERMASDIARLMYAPGEEIKRSPGRPRKEAAIAE